MTKIFGEFNALPRNSQEYLIMGFSPCFIPIQQRWRNNGLSADFLADYLATFFPISDSDPISSQKRKEIRGAVSYIANELLENAMKFNDENTQYPISLQFQLYRDHLVLSATNSTHKENAVHFQSFIEELLRCDPQEFYIRQIKRAEENENTTNNSTGLGLLTMLDDYNAKLGWKFETLQENYNEIMVVTTMVQLPI